jgi:alkyl sulfatase BDS1-like metallo-beta-lactamase superfamily hydrolase
MRGTLREVKELACSAVLHGEHQKAQLLYRKLVAAAPADPVLRRHYADSLRQLGRTAEAAVQYVAAAQLYFAVQQLTQARALARLALAVDSGNVEAMACVVEWSTLPSKPTYEA